MTERDPHDRPDDGLLERLGPALAAESLEAAMLLTADLGALLSGIQPVAVFLFENGEVEREAWSPARDEVPAVVRSAFRRAGLALTGAAASDDGQAPPARAFPLAMGGRTLGAVVMPEQGLEPARVRSLQLALALLAPRFAAQLERRSADTQRAQHERWFRTLDEQLRVLDRERQKFSAMVHQSGLAVFVADPTGKVQWTNGVLSAITPPPGEPAGWVGRSCSAVCGHYAGASAPKCADCPVYRAIGANAVTHLEIRREEADGPRDHYMTAIPIKGTDGRPAEVMVMIQDVSDLEIVRRAEDRLRTVVSRAPIVLFSIDSDGRFTMSEGRGLEALGLRPGEVVGRSALEIYRDVPQIVDSIQRALGGEEVRDVLRVGPLAFETSFVPLRGAEGAVTGLIGVATDVTERHRLESQLLQSQKMEAIGRLAGGVAHDFNNLLAAILGHTELALSRLEPHHPLRESLEQVAQAGSRGALLTRQLLSFSRKQVIAPQVLDVNAVVGEMEGLLRRLIGEDIEFMASAALTPVHVRMDRGQLEQILMNLVVNARDALPGGGKITVEVAGAVLDESYARSHAGVAPGRYALLSVSDNGCGMDTDTMARVFEPFFTTKADGQGTGLGLATVYAHVQQAGGHIWLYSEPGLGTTFKVYLREVDAAQVEECRGAEAPLSAGGGETILLVEDDDSVRSLVRDALKTHGYSVVEARHGADALWQLQQDDVRADLLITDVVMPQMGGGELAQRLRALRPELKVLYMSGYPDDAVVRQGVVEGGAPFLQKPFSLEGLARKVREVLDSGSGPVRRAA